MICVSDLQGVISQWLERMGNPSQSFEYKTGINECINDLNQLIDHSLQEELDYQDMLEQEAEEYFSNIEPEDYYAA